MNTCVLLHFERKNDVTIIVELHKATPLILVALYKSLTMIVTSYLVITNIGEIHYHKENKTNGGKQIEFSAESNQFEKNQKWE